MAPLPLFWGKVFRRWDLGLDLGVDGWVGIEQSLHSGDFRGWWGGHSFWVRVTVGMPDHVHVLITPAIDVSTAKDVQYIKGGYSRALGWEASWCAGYHDHRVRDGRDYESQRLYIANHPARKRYEDYPHVCAEMAAAPGHLCELGRG